VSDLVAVRGDNETYDLTVVLPSGSPVNLTDATLWFTVKKNKYEADAAALISKTSALNGGITIANQGTDPGEAAIALVPADTAKLVPGDYYFDVQMKSSTGTVTTLADGIIEITADVTRATSLT
jgi:hypothetical protein